MAGIEGLLHGRILGGRYRIEEVIGRGGMGAVYRAVDERLGRSVAVKVITIAGASDPESRERLRARFHREARAAAALPHHPNVVPVYDYGTDETLSLDYLVMELLRGSDLSTRLSRAGPPPLASALRILHESARGVAVGHRAGLIHRDVKPGNIFLTESSHGDVQVRVVDFGIAKLAADEDTFSQLTQDGRAPHSPAYASPEQLRGLGQLTPASDVFSLGAVGFQLLTGERPFTESDRNKMSLGMPVPAPTMRDRNPAIPAPIEATVRKALAFEPTHRFPDAMTMASALEQSLRSLPDTPIEPYLDSPAIPVSRLPDERAAEDDRTHLAGAEEDDRTLLAPAGAPSRAGGGGPPRGGRVAAGDRSPSAARPLPPRRPVQQRRGIGGILVWTLVLLLLTAAGVWAWYEMSARPQFAESEPLPEAPADVPVILPDQTVPEEIGTQPELDALVHNQEGLRLFRERDFAAALEQFRLARDLSRENPEYRFNYALVLRQLGIPEEAAEELRRVIRLQPGRAGAYYHLGLSQLEVGDTTAARASLEAALERSADPPERGAIMRRLQSLDRAQRAAPTPAPADSPAAGYRDTVYFPAARDTTESTPPR